MNELQKYVERLFRHQPGTAQVRDLKEEILSNMTAKRDDFVAQGLDEAAATRRAEESLASLDGLLDDSQLTYVDRYRRDCLQAALLGSAVFWLLSLPLLFTQAAAVCFCGVLTTALLGAAYLAKARHCSDAANRRSVTASVKRGRLVWIVWGLFFLVSAGSAAALRFASYLWYSPVGFAINGPSQLANLAAQFYAPLLTIVIPITVSGFTKHLIQNEWRPDDA